MKYLVWSAEHCGILEFKGLLTSGHNLPSAAVNIWSFEQHTKCYTSIMFSVKGLSSPTKKLPQANKIRQFCWSRNVPIPGYDRIMKQVVYGVMFLLTCRKQVNSCMKGLNHMDLVDQLPMCHIHDCPWGGGAANNLKIWCHTQLCNLHTM